MAMVALLDYASSGEEDVRGTGMADDAGSSAIISRRPDLAPEVDITGTTEMRSYVNPNTKQLTVNPTYEALSEPGALQPWCVGAPAAVPRSGM